MVAAAIPGSKIKTFGPKSGGGTTGASAGGQPTMTPFEPESVALLDASGPGGNVASLDASPCAVPPSSGAPPPVPMLPLPAPPGPVVTDEPAVPVAMLEEEVLPPTPAPPDPAGLGPPPSEEVQARREAERALPSETIRNTLFFMELPGGAGTSA